MTLAQQIAYLARHGGIQPPARIWDDEDLRGQVVEALRGMVEADEAAAEAELAQIAEPEQPQHPSITWFLSDPARVARCHGMHVAVRGEEVLRMEYAPPPDSLREEIERDGGALFYVRRPEE